MGGDPFAHVRHKVGEEAPGKGSRRIVGDLVPGIVVHPMKETRSNDGTKRRLTHQWQAGANVRAPMRVEVKPQGTVPAKLLQDGGTVKCVVRQGVLPEVRSVRVTFSVTNGNATPANTIELAAVEQWFTHTEKPNDTHDARDVKEAAAYLRPATQLLAADPDLLDCETPLTGTAWNSGSEAYTGYTLAGGETKNMSLPLRDLLLTLPGAPARPFTWKEKSTFHINLQVVKDRVVKALNTAVLTDLTISNFKFVLEGLDYAPPINKWLNSAWMSRKIPVGHSTVQIYEETVTLTAGTATSLKPRLANALAFGAIILRVEKDATSDWRKAASQGCRYLGDAAKINLQYKTENIQRGKELTVKDWHDEFLVRGLGARHPEFLANGQQVGTDRVANLHFLPLGTDVGGNVLQGTCQNGCWPIDENFELEITPASDFVDPGVPVKVTVFYHTYEVVQTDRHIIFDTPTRVDPLPEAEA